MRIHICGVHRCKACKNRGKKDELGLWYEAMSAQQRTPLLLAQFGFSQPLFKVAGIHQMAIQTSKRVNAPVFLRKFVSRFFSDSQIFGHRFPGFIIGKIHIIIHCVKFFIESLEHISAEYMDRCSARTHLVHDFLLFRGFLKETLDYFALAA